MDAFGGALAFTVGEKTADRSQNDENGEDKPATSKLSDQDIVQRLSSKMVEHVGVQ